MPGIETRNRTEEKGWANNPFLSRRVPDKVLYRATRENNKDCRAGFFLSRKKGTKIRGAGALRKSELGSGPENLKRTCF